MHWLRVVQADGMRRTLFGNSVIVVAVFEMPGQPVVPTNCSGRPTCPRQRQAIQRENGEDRYTCLVKWSTFPMA